MSPRLPAVTPRKLIRVLEMRGWALDHVKDSHHYFRHLDYPHMAVVPYHGKDLKRGTLHGILTAAGISREELQQLL